MGVKVELGMTIDKAVEHIRNTSWDRITIIGFIGEDVEVLSSERSRDKVLSRLKQAFPELDTETVTTV